MGHSRYLVAVLALTVLTACGGGGLFGHRSGAVPPDATNNANVAETAAINHASGADKPRATIFDLFNKNTDPNVTVRVNKYIWNASLDVLNFLPIQSVDPFTGVIVTGYGTPPGGGRSYRATIYVQDPALDARSLKLSLQGSNGASVAPETVNAVEDAILNRARQLRIADSHL